MKRKIKFIVIVSVVALLIMISRVVVVVFETAEP